MLKIALNCAQKYALRMGANNSQMLRTKQNSVKPGSLQSKVKCLQSNVKCFLTAHTPPGDQGVLVKRLLLKKVGEIEINHQNIFGFSRASCTLHALGKQCSVK